MKNRQSSPAFALPVLTAQAEASNQISAHTEASLAVADAAGSDARPSNAPAYGRQYWRSIAEQNKDPAVEADRGPEFPEGADLAPEGFMRRDFLKLASASLALAGLNACTEKPVEKILPYTKNPEGMSPGIPLHYATAAQVGGTVSGLVVTAWEGRPTKVDGNPLHPINRGATGVLEQAWLLQLYDGNRAQQIREGKTPKAWRSFREEMRAHADRLEKTGGESLRFLVEPSTSPLILSLRSQLLKRFPQAKFYSYSAIHDDAPKQGAQLALGAPYECRPDLVNADTILSLDSDLLDPRGTGLTSARAFADRRDPKKAGPTGLNRLYAVEPSFSLTGMMADHRLRMKAAEVQPFALAVLGQLATQVPALSRFHGLADKYGVPAAYTKWVQALVKDLTTQPGRSLVVAGEHQPALVHAIAHVINAGLGNVGKTVRYAQPVTHDAFSGPAGHAALLAEVKAGKVDTLIVTASNPVYTAPADVQFASVLGQVPNTVYLSLYEDETAGYVRWLVPAAHPLEAWGDHRSVDGTVSIAQPLIQPLFNGMTEADVLATLLGGGEKSSYVMLRELWSRSPQSGIDFESSWEKWLVDGFIPGTAIPYETPEVDAGAVLAAANNAKLPTTSGLEVRFVHDYKMYDGRFANVPWLQELPDPITKLTWDNAALVSPTTAKKLNLKDEDVVALTYQGRTVNAPILLAPGHADDCVTVSLGWGRESAAEEVAHKRGFNGYLLRTVAAPWFDNGLDLKKTGETYPLSLTQTHWSMKMDWEEKERPIALVQTVKEFETKNEAEDLRGVLPNFYDHVKYEDYRWAMSIDLSRCIGCNSCAMACQAENNIPVVGKDQVGKGREMNWLRIDRYFSGDIEDPTVVTQPVMCQHCENAPCEYVCPVNATVHSDEGLNEMVYNRCIGTRYCSNNCPYKVRRFNYLHWQAELTPMQQMKMNPDVTVRARGVMEKCTYCVQRIERTRIQSRVEKRPIRDGELRTACQQACPTEAIVFGTLSDRDSRVTQLHADERRYDLLHSLGTRPRTGYLVRLKNPNPDLA